VRGSILRAGGEGELDGEKDRERGREKTLM
jgi:hypothetical protein